MNLDQMTQIEAIQSIFTPLVKKCIDEYGKNDTKIALLWITKELSRDMVVDMWKKLKVGKDAVDKVQ